MNEFPESIKFVESADSQHAWKRLNDEGGVEYTSPLFASRELAEADARATINGTHTVEAPMIEEETVYVAEGEPVVAREGGVVEVIEASAQPEAVGPAPEGEVPADEPAPEAPAEVPAE